MIEGRGQEQEQNDAVQQECQEGTSSNAKAVWKEEGNQHLLRNGQQAWSGQESNGTGEQRLQEAAQAQVNVNNHTWHLTGLKWCRGPLHEPEGVLLPCLPDDPDKSAFWFHGPDSKRPGKPLSRCKRCMRFEKGRDPDHGLVPVDQVRPLIEEIIRRLGIAEMHRRCGLSPNFWPRLVNHTYKNVKPDQYERINAVYQEVTTWNVWRNPNDIRHGAAARGKVETKREQKRRHHRTERERLARYGQSSPGTGYGDPDQLWFYQDRATKAMKRPSPGKLSMDEVRAKNYQVPLGQMPSEWWWSFQDPDEV
jgi:hypothetical protein